MNEFSYKSGFITTYSLLFIRIAMHINNMAIDMNMVNIQYFYTVFVLYEVRGQYHPLTLYVTYYWPLRKTRMNNLLIGFLINPRHCNTTFKYSTPNIQRCNIITNAFLRIL